MKELVREAHAKVNLGLDVLRKRPDGYHELRMIMQSLQLSDRITMKKREIPGVVLQIDRDDLSAGPDNLICRAAQMLIDEFHLEDGVEIFLEKKIPMAAGLAGGSTDAAAVLIGMNQMFSLGLTREELMARGVRIGADVPYCILGGTALAEGIGEKLTPLVDAPDFHVVLAKPPVQVSTAFVYGNLRANELTEHPDIASQLSAVEEQDREKIARYMGNVLETVTVPAYPVIKQIQKELLEFGAVNAMMSGSGPTVFGLFTELEKAQAAVSSLRNADYVGDLILTSFAGKNDLM